MIGAKPELTLSARPLVGRGRNMTLPENRRQRIPKSVEARAAAIRIGRGLGLGARELAAIFQCHLSEVVRPEPIPLSRQIDVIGRKRRRMW